MVGLIGKKVGMTQVFDEAGNVTPVTVINVETNIVVGCKTKEKFGYDAVILGVGNKKNKKMTKPYKGQFPESIQPKIFVKEFRDFGAELAVGDEVGPEILQGVRFLDITAVSKGKGFQGVMKRWDFQGGRASHGSKFHREPGSTGQCTSPGHSFKNIKMPGRMGCEKVTVQNLKLVKIDTSLKLILVCGAVPGVRENVLIVKSAVKK